MSLASLVADLFTWSTPKPRRGDLRVEVADTQDGGLDGSRPQIRADRTVLGSRAMASEEFQDEERPPYLHVCLSRIQWCAGLR